MAVARVLVVDDDAMVRTALARVIHHLGAACDLVADGSEAIAAAATGRYDLILMDVNMPGLDGPAAARAILAATPGVQIIGMTGGVDAARRDECARSGMSLLLDKPVRIADLTRFLKPTAAP